MTIAMFGEIKLIGKDHVIVAGDPYQFPYAMKLHTAINLGAQLNMRLTNEQVEQLMGCSLAEIADKAVKDAVEAANQRYFREHPEEAILDTPLTDAQKANVPANYKARLFLADGMPYNPGNRLFKEWHLNMSKTINCNPSVVKQIEALIALFNVISDIRSYINYYSANDTDFRFSFNGVHTEPVITLSQMVNELSEWANFVRNRPMVPNDERESIRKYDAAMFAALVDVEKFTELRIEVHKVTSSFFMTNIILP